MAPFIILLVGNAISRRRGGGDSEPAGRVDVEDDGLDVELVAATVVVVLPLQEHSCRVVSSDVTVKRK